MLARRTVSPLLVLMLAAGGALHAKKPPRAILKTQGVRIVAIDGEDLGGREKSASVAPGRHEISCVLHQYVYKVGGTYRSSPINNGPMIRGKQRLTMEVEVEAGKKYLLEGKVTHWFGDDLPKPKPFSVTMQFLHASGSAAWELTLREYWKRSGNAFMETTQRHGRGPSGPQRGDW